MSTRPTLLEVDLLGGLTALSAHDGPRVLVGPPGAEDEAAVVRLLVREGRAFHATERAEAVRRFEEATREAEARRDDVGEAFAADRAAAARADIAAHEAALSAIDEDAVRTLLARFTLRPRAVLTQPPPPPALVVELAGDGWALVEEEAARRQARAAFLGIDP